MSIIWKCAEIIHVSYFYFLLLLLFPPAGLVPVSLQELDWLWAWGPT